jgi:hypothetical protein
MLAATSGDLQARFDTTAVGEGPDFFADLDGITRVEEQAAIDAGRIQASGLDYVGHLRAPSRRGSSQPERFLRTEQHPRRRKPENVNQENQRY